MLLLSCVLDKDHQDKADTDGKSLNCKVYDLQGLSLTQVCLEESSR